MRFARILGQFVFGVIFLAMASHAEKSADLPPGVEVGSYTGWDECVFMRTATRSVQAVMVPAIGGRIVQFSLNGENILFENAASQGKTLANTKTQFWATGYQCDVGPELRDLPLHQRLWLGPHHWRAETNWPVKVYSETDPRLGVKLEKEFVLNPKTGELGVMQRLRNTSHRDVSYCLWDRTLCKGGGFAFFPVNPKSRFKAGWSQRKSLDDKYVYDGESPDSPQVQVVDGILVAEAKGEATKIGADSDAGWIGYVRGKLLFVKFYPYSPKGNYTDGGNTVEVYFDQRVAEIEPLSPEMELWPEQNFSFAEEWVLIGLDKEVTTVDQIRNLVKKIPPSPFLKAPEKHLK